MIVLKDDNTGIESSYAFSIIVYDYPRLATLWDFKMRVNSVQDFILPVIEEFSPMTIAHSSPLPSFIKLESLTYTMSPVNKADLGFFTI